MDSKYEHSSTINVQRYNRVSSDVIDGRNVVVKRQSHHKPHENHCTLQRMCTFFFSFKENNMRTLVQFSFTDNRKFSHKQLVLNLCVPDELDAGASR